MAGWYEYLVLASAVFLGVNYLFLNIGIFKLRKELETGRIYQLTNMQNLSEFKDRIDKILLKAEKWIGLK